MLFYKNYIDVYCYYSLKSMCMQSFVLIGCCVSELHGHICPYHNVWPEAVYCCFTRTTLFTKLYTFFLEVAIISPSFVVLYRMVSEIVNALPEAVYCCFTRTTLFTELSTCFYDQSYRSLSYHQVLLLYTFQFLR